ncbi:MAG: B3/4 domain-containing protein [Aquificota bacterium]|nr:B3/4 domain-containing protein [Aquificota bacterium]
MDITNYVLLQEGQPLHAFDLDRLEGSVHVRSAKKGEKMKTLDGEERELSPEVLIIADERKPIAIAGIIGGLESGVTSATRNVLLESAYFLPSRVGRGSKLIGVQTESRLQF